MLARVNFSYDGATGGLRIDIVLAEQKNTEPQMQKVLGEKPVIEFLPNEPQDEICTDDGEDKD